MAKFSIWCKLYSWVTKEFQLVWEPKGCSLICHKMWIRQSQVKGDIKVSKWPFWAKINVFKCLTKMAAWGTNEFYIVWEPKGCSLICHKIWIRQSQAKRDIKVSNCLSCRKLPFCNFNISLSLPLLDPDPTLYQFSIDWAFIHTWTHWCLGMPSLSNWKCWFCA